ncbi:uncharacterized protein LOC100880856 isoform X2 [Megachile rotundata]|uniref:uncharacterized protein LOC100880856 isoform X2 n=1 Tax=Megachile rotundata TaxID=143995 RepID=UPI003FD66D5B
MTHFRQPTCFSAVKDDRFMMARSKGNVRKVGTLPYREYSMELRSMSKRPPPYVDVDSLRFMNLHDDSTTRRKHGSNKIRVEEDKSPPVIIRSGCAKYPRVRYFMCCSVGLLILLICAILINVLFPYPLHASCIVKWTFGDSCTYTMQKFRCQILNWSSCANCGPRGNRCLYTLKEPKPDESNVIRAVHFAPNLKTMENIKIAFEEINKTCAATVLQYPFNYFNYYNLIYRLQHYLLSKGESTSNDWFRVFDYGRNYCNLRNLVTGIGFDKSSKFLELTSNAVCTQYNMAICE